MNIDFLLECWCRSKNAKIFL